MKYIAPLLLIIACGDPVSEPGWGELDASTVPSVDAGSTPGDSGSVAPDASSDAGEQSTDTGVSAECDRDEDGYAAESCGGYDCDDANRVIHPDSEERCSF